ncbi:MAG: peptidoglycan D,D-transpeptidase FtsI family protein [Candidatus Brocadiia bacterium]
MKSNHQQSVQEQPTRGGMAPMRRRSLMGAGLLTLVFLVLGGRLYEIQVEDQGRYRERARRQRTLNRALAGRRGNIYDRSGRMLATSVKRWSIYADPAVMEAPERTALILARLLGRDEKRMIERFRRGNRFAWVARQVSDETAEKVRNYGMEGVHFRKEYHRLHPPGQLFGHVIGFTDIDGAGISGAELQFDSLLKSSPGREKVLRDALGRVMQDAAAESAPPSDGYDVQLTIDAFIQDTARRALKKQIDRHEPDSAWAVVMDVETGAVLAMVSWPDFDPNVPGSADAGSRRNRVISDAYEFGSVMKPITVAAALENDVVRPDTEFDCHNGAWRVGRRVVHDVHGHETLNVRNILAQSSNIGVAQIGLELGTEPLHEMLRRFGFGRPTGINLPGEAIGILRPPERWNKHSLISVSFGQEIASTPLSVANAFVAIANGGHLLRPRVVRNVVDSETGRAVWRMNDRRTVRRVIERRTATQVMEMMRLVVTDGTGSRVGLEEYPVAGKTGTASIASPDSGGYSDQYLSSFVGIAPSDAPKVVALVSLKNPTQGSHYGSTVAGPACREILRETLRYLQVPERSSAHRTAEMSR